MALMTSEEYEKHLYYMNLALEEAKKAYQKNEVPVGVVIVRGEEILARAHNLKHSMNMATKHAEILAIEEANKKIQNWRLTDATLYATIEPCSMCAGAIYSARIKNLMIGAREFKSGACGTTIDVLSNPKINHRVNTIFGFLEEECLALLQDFFQKKRTERWPSG